jgi:hypothetical protein
MIAPGQLFRVGKCLSNMERKKEEARAVMPVPPPGSQEMDVETPLWHKYYVRVRKTARFPRYYKRDLNW